MSRPLPRLRLNLDFMPSPVEDRPGLLVRDPYHYSDATLIIPPPLVGCLELFDGERTELDLRERLVQVTGDLNVGELVQHLLESLSSVGFLEDENYQRLRDERKRNFAEAEVREAGHAGTAYPAEPGELKATLNNYLHGAAPSGQNGLMAIAAPHVSPFGGWECYREAYAALSGEYRDRTFVVLGTSHYGEADRLGLTRKDFVTPYGRARTDAGLVNRLAADAGPAVTMEDYCHAVEHSIEFQVVFLQHLFGGDLRVVPILCGSYATSLYRGGLPEDDENVRRLVGALGEMAAREGRRLFWVLGVDMAHIGRRYGDQFVATADRGEMQEVSERDKARIERMETGDAAGFWNLVQENQDDLKWCGSAPIYTFLRAVPQARGKLLRYQQWNIDPQSVVSFAGMTFE